MSLATAADLPPELIDNIVRWFCCDKLEFLYEGSLGACKRELGLFSLTCRHWARRCRFHIFQELTLRTREDLDTFLELIDPPVKVEPIMIDCLIRLIINYSGPWVKPWLHLVYTGMARYGEESMGTRRTTLRLSGVYRHQDRIAKDTYAPTSWCEGLPRSLPGSMLPMNELTLSDMRFHNTAELLRLVQSIPELRELRCTKLNFDDKIPSRYTDHRHKRARNFLRLIQVTECGSSSDDLDLAFLITGVQAPHGFFKHVFRDFFSQWDVLHGAARAICGMSMSKNIRLFAQTGMDPPAFDMKINMLNAEAVASHGIDIRVQSAPNNSFSASVTSVEFFFLKQLKVGDVASMDWQAIEQAALDVHPAEKLRIYAPELSVFEWFLDAVPAGKILSRLCHPSKVEILYTYGPRLTAGITAEKILRAPSTYTVDGQTVQLKRPQIIRLAACKGDVQKQKFLREILDSPQTERP